MTTEPIMNAKEWLETEEGKAGNNIKTLTGQEYLTNRLIRAFNAGAKVGGAYQILLMNSALDMAKLQIESLKQTLQDTLQREHRAQKELKRLKSK